MGKQWKQCQTLFSWAPKSLQMVTAAYPAPPSMGFSRQEYLSGLPLPSPKGTLQSWIFIERMDAEAETPIIWPPDVKNWLIWKDSDAGKDWRREEKGTTEYEMVGWHHRFDGHEFEWTPGVGDGQGGLACCSSWDHKELDMTERLNRTELMI